MAGEITAIFASLRQNKIGAALITGFAQVAQSPMLKEYLFRGRDLSWKKVEKLNQFFIDEHIPIPSSSDSFVTDSVIAPFSDKLMAVNILFLQTASIQQDCFGFTNSLRHDLLTYFAGSALETGKYAEDGVDILI
ncbi:MAG: DUF3231 family protein [Desulfitobacteriaceae bacterium]|nr:DUF3231 family protein [Desulfitobacteriaceae bacterium]MDD4402326.1 DUF3231 family protein [Desulfitobacteriaceae bacterium]